MDYFNSLCCVLKILQQIALFTSGNADVLHLVEELEIVIANIFTVMFGEILLLPVLWRFLGLLDH